ncbi:MAG: hypothetical protein J4F28_00725 [Nitrosopumilaceae archaeon]|nr:hypothetical protein [Nitrosopumilaceae archaeon]
MGPLTRRYDIMDRNDEEMLAVAADSIQNMIAGNRRININDVMLLYGACAYSSAAADRQGSCMSAIEEWLPDMLSDHQVMIGVPDMIKRLEISITDRAGGDAVNVVMQDPIRPASYMKWGLSQGQSAASASASFSNSNGSGSSGDISGRMISGDVP